MSTPNSVKVMPRAVVCEDSQLFGDITISAGCVIHTNAKIVAEAGPIIIGQNCIVEEYATIANRCLDREKYECPMVIGDNNVFEVGCTIEARKIGHGNVFECKCVVSTRTVVLNGCVIGARCCIDSEQLFDGIAVHGNNRLHKYSMERQTVLQIESLKKIVPNYHRLKKTSDPKKTRASAH